MSENHREELLLIYVIVLRVFEENSLYKSRKGLVTLSCEIQKVGKN